MGCNGSKAKVEAPTMATKESKAETATEAETTAPENSPVADAADITPPIQMDEPSPAYSMLCCATSQ
eukprot:Skav235994  [mRNA]  locus=scaffold348:241913:242113:+ [translate_table: standard]